MNDLRTVARSCLEAALKAVDGERLVEEALAADASLTSRDEGSVVLIAAGKAAMGMARGALETMGNRVARGVVVVTEGKSARESEIAGQRIEVLVAGHPVPDDGSVKAAKRVRDLAGNASSGEMVLVLLSGGASSLLTLPASSLLLAHVQETTEQLLAAGASIDELNVVRKHLDELKGGGLARVTGHVPVLALVLSDVVGDRLDVIASGPLEADPTTFRDAVDVLRTRGLWHEVPEAVSKHLLAGTEAERGEEAGSRDHRLCDVDTRIIGNSEMAARAAMAEAARLGFEARLLTTSLEGEARAIGGWVAVLEREVRDLGRPVAPPACLVAGGETTVTVRGAGRGGRNQELALAAALAIEGRDDVLVTCFATDGVDGPTDAAGAWVDGGTVARARELGLDPRQALAANDSYSFFAALGDHIMTGPTGTNVMDLVLVLVDVHRESRH